MSALRHTHRQATCARLSLRTPAGSIRRSWQPARRCSAAAAQQHQQAQHESQAALERQSPTSSSSPPSSLLTATAFTLLAPLLRVPAAWADEAEDIVIEQVDALEAESLSKVVQAVQEEQSLYDTLVSIIFTGVVLALTVVTLGVAYLSLTQWLDSRQEKKDQEEEKNPKKPTFTTSQSDSDKEKEEAVTLKKAFAVKRDKTKGFGSGNVTTTPKEF